ncbi:hypothetical protein B0H11DRAFT_2188444 [Mycena galericulata]|nr:hypothetical protein B0H11DRAFT_2188444 [Mycena galericulata]
MPSEVKSMNETACLADEEDVGEDIRRSGRAQDFVEPKPAPTRPKPGLSSPTRPEQHYSPPRVIRPTLLHFTYIYVTPHPTTRSPPTPKFPRPIFFFLSFSLRMDTGRGYTRGFVPAAPRSGSRLEHFHINKFSKTAISTVEKQLHTLLLHHSGERKKNYAGNSAGILDGFEDPRVRRRPAGNPYGSRPDPYAGTVFAGPGTAFLASYSAVLEIQSINHRARRRQKCSAHRVPNADTDAKYL